MKKLVLLIAATHFSISLWGQHICCIEKSLAIWNSESNQLEVTKALTREFPISQESHQDAFELFFKKEDGSNWGKVSVSTATHFIEGSKQITCNASITNENLELLAFLTLYADSEAKYSKALTQMNISDGFPPSVSIICKKASDESEIF